MTLFHRNARSRLRNSAYALVLLPALASTPFLGQQESVSSACPDVVTVNDIAVGLNVEECDVVGQQVTIAGMGVQVPDKGEGIQAFALSTSGEGGAFRLETAADGSVTGTLEVEPEIRDQILLQVGSPTLSRGTGSTGNLTITSPQHDATPPPQAMKAAAAFDRCELLAHAMTGGHWTTDPQYRVNVTEGLPANISGLQFSSAVQAASYTWVHNQNSCGDTRKPSALNFVVGSQTTSNSNVNGAQNTCATDDGLSVVDFGNLSGSTIGFACWWMYSGGAISSVDIRIDNSGSSWTTTTASCSGTRWDLQGVLTHEFGHLIGLAHVAERGPGDLVMSTNTDSCDFSSRLLGHGDTLGLLSLYY
jgi:hypothetical protein